MGEVIIKVNIPLEFKEEFKVALAKVVKEFVKRIRFLELEQMLKKVDSKEEQNIIEQSIKLGRKVNKSLHKRYKKLYQELE